MDRINTIDFWRTLAATGVLYTHAWAIAKFPSYHLLGVDVFKVLNLWGNGVHLFFVISGLCFYLVLSKKHAITFNDSKDFLIKRWLRIAPAFYIACIVYAITYFPVNAELVKKVLFNFLFIQNHFQNRQVAGIFWSLAVEWHFYLFLPVLFFFISRYSFIASLICLMLLGLALNVLHFYNDPRSDTSWQYTIFANVEHFGWGILLGYLFKKNVLQASKLLATFLLVIGLCIAYGGKIFFTKEMIERTGNLSFVFQSAGPLIMTFGFSVMIFFSLQETYLKKLFNNAFLSRMGRVSFSFYLWHAIVLNTLSALLLPHVQGYSKVVMFVIIFVSTYALLIPVSLLSFKYFESFYFRMKRHA